MSASLRRFQNLNEQDAGNPLLEGLGQEKSFQEWAIALQYDPRQDWQKPYPFPPLLTHADAVRDAFFPTTNCINAVCAMDTMLRVSLRRRDPRIAHNRRRIYEVLRGAAADHALGEIPKLSAKAMGALIIGPTGCSKTHTVDHYLLALPQVLHHGLREDCGFSQLDHVVYLKVELPNDARESSLYHVIADALDERLKTTSYGKQIRSRALAKVSDKLAHILLWLSLHCVGLLILEEMQEKQTAPEVLGREFAGAFLKIMNSGIPLVLVGNPLAFEHIEDFTQDVGRLTVGGRHEMVPPFDANDSAWKEDLVPGIWGWKCFNEPDEFVPDLHQILYERTGAVPKYLADYRIATLKEAIKSGARRVTYEHMNSAFHSPEMIGLHHIIEAYSTKKESAFEGMRDQPYPFLKKAWDRERKRRDWIREQEKRFSRGEPAND